MTAAQRPGFRASLRTRVAIAAALAAAVVVGALVVLTSIVLASNDVAQLDRRLDAIVNASVSTGDPWDPTHGVLSTGRSASTGQVMFQRGFQLPSLPPGTETVTVNGVDYRVRTVTVDRQGGLLVSIGIRADSILLNPARIPLYVAIGVVALLIAAGLGWLLGGVATRPLRRLTEQTRRLGKAGGDQIVPVHGAKEAEDLSEAMVGMLHPVGGGAGGHHEVVASGSGLRRERRARVAHAADRDAGRPGHVAHPRAAAGGAR